MTIVNVENTKYKLNPHVVYIVSSYLWHYKTRKIKKSLYLELDKSVLSNQKKYNLYLFTQHTFIKPPLFVHESMFLKPLSWAWHCSRH